MPGERVLLVEDNATSAKLMVYLLKAHGYEVAVAQDAEAALAAIRQHHPDLVLMDVQLPGVDGLEIVRQLRADVASRGIPIIAVTAYAMKGDKEKALVAGCDDYITKPIDTRTLPAAIAKLLQRP
jgi:CheY-like chemotaxis protein